VQGSRMPPNPSSHLTCYGPRPPQPGEQQAPVKAAEYQTLGMVVVLPLTILALLAALGRVEPYPVALALGFVVCALWFGVGWFTKRRGQTMARQ
jgi:hypothetical protein